MKKSRSSVPRLPDKLELGPAPPVRYEGLLGADGLPEPDPAAPPAPPFIEIAVGNTHEGASFPAKPDSGHVRRVSRVRVDERTEFRKASSAGNLSASQPSEPVQAIRTCP